MSQSTPATGQNHEVAFDLIMQGVGYLNRVREVKVRKGPSYLACSINAMMGKGEDVQYVAIDCKLVGRQAQDAVQVLRPDVDARRKVIVGFRASDPRPEFYEFERNGAMEQREGLKARLLQLTFAKVDGRRVEIPLVDGRPVAQTPRAGLPADDSGEARDEGTVAEA